MGRGAKIRCLAKIIVLPLAFGACLQGTPGPDLSEPSYCDEQPMRDPSFESASYGRTSNGFLLGAVRVEAPALRVLPLRHGHRCLSWTTPRLAHALAAASARVQRELADSPPLSHGNFSRAAGGVIAYSRSHQSGRDADLAFYQIDAGGRPILPDDLARFGPDLWRAGEDGGGVLFDVARNWLLVAALLEDPSIDVQWLLIEETLRFALLEEGRRLGASAALLHRAAQALHQPSDSAAHDDHLHLRIRCTAAEQRRGCTD